MIKGILFGMSLILALPLLWFLPTTQEEGVNPWIGQAALRSFDVEVHAVGELEAAHSTLIASTLPSDLGKVIFLIDDGSAVEAGDLLVKMDPAPFDQWIEELEGKIAAQEAAVQAAGQALAWEKQQAGLEGETVELELRTAEMELEKVIHGDGPVEAAQLEDLAKRSEQKCEELEHYLAELKILEEDGYLSPGELAQCERELVEAKESATQARLKHETYVNYALPMQRSRAETALERMRMRQKEQERSAAHKIASAEATLHHAGRLLDSMHQQIAAAHVQRQATEIRAPNDGMVVLAESYRAGERRKAQLGDVVTKNQPLIKLPDLGEMVVRTAVREIDLHKLCVGTQASVEVDAYPDLGLSGRVTQIGVLALSGKRIGGGKAFEVVIAIDETSAPLRPGMTAQVTLHAYSVVDALTVPIQALFDEEERRVCFRQNEEGYEAVAVELGPCSEEWAVLTGGLAEGDLVCLTLRPDELH